MQLPARRELARSKGRDDSDPYWKTQLGEVGEPTIYVNEVWAYNNRKLNLGEVIDARRTDKDTLYTYVVKEYKDGWWKLEWPD